MKIEHEPSFHSPKIKTIIPLRSLTGGLILVVATVGAIIWAVIALPRIWAEIQYPLAYQDLIVQEANDHDLDPYFVAAVVYAESRFKPNATSYAGARGLMQLMPATALGISRKMSDTTFTVDKLYTPEVNLRYGTFHLQGLMGRYDSNEAAALVAYNAGGGAGDRYSKGDRLSVPQVSIGYSQKVLRAKEAYKSLYPQELQEKTTLDTIFLPDEPVEETLVSKILNVIRANVLSQIEQ